MVMSSQQLQSLALLEERIERAVELIARLKGQRQRSEEEAARLLESEKVLERRLEALADENRELLEEGRRLRARNEEWVRFEHDRDEIRTRIDGMLAKFEELEI